VEYDLRPKNLKLTRFFIYVYTLNACSMLCESSCIFVKKTFWQTAVHTTSVLMKFTFKMWNNTVLERQNTIHFGYSTRYVWYDVLWIIISRTQSRCLGNQPHSTKANVTTNVERCYGLITLGVGTQWQMDGIWGSTEKKNSSMKVKYRQWKIWN
jgi:hypothetical protein